MRSTKVGTMQRFDDRYFYIEVAKQICYLHVLKISFLSERPLERLSKMIHVLHLSDLHFDPTSEHDSSTWYGQLSQDLMRLGCETLDALVISGDIGYYSTAEE